MTAFDYVFPLLLMLSVLRQIRGKRLTWTQLAWPLGLVAWATGTYVRGFPATTAAVLLVVCCAVVGVGLGSAAGWRTHVYVRGDGAVMARATGAAVTLWIVGTIGRLVFGLYAEHGGGPAISAFGTAHDIAFAAWPAALTLMALAEVIGRTVTLAPRMLSASKTKPRGSPAVP